MITNTGNKKDIEVFVTSEVVTDNLCMGEVGRWFNLKDFETKEQFVEAAKNYVETALHDDEHRIDLVSSRANIEVYDLIDIDNNEVSSMIWDLLKLSQEDISILNAFHSFHGSYENGINETLAAAKRDYIGYFATERDVVCHLLVEAGATDEVIELLGDECDWHKIACNENTGFSHENHYFDL